MSMKPKDVGSGLTQARLRELLSYDQETGIWTWNIDLKGPIKAGSVAGHIDPRRGYVQICIDYQDYHAHRLAWFWMTGEWPKADIDHENGRPSDNWWTNLREATRSQNCANRRASPNRSGFKGVSYSNPKKKWRARVKRGGRNVYCSYHDTPEDAHRAYCAKAAELFGGYARAA